MLVFTNAELLAIEAEDVACQQRAKTLRDLPLATDPERDRRAIAARAFAMAEETVEVAVDPIVNELMQLRYDFRFVPELAERLDALVEVARSQ